MIKRIFLAHPQAVDEGYFEHMGMAFGFARRLILCGLACTIHALVPALFTRTASSEVSGLYDRMCLNRNRKIPPIVNYQI